MAGCQSLELAALSSRVRVPLAVNWFVLEVAKKDFNEELKKKIDKMNWSFTLDGRIIFYFRNNRVIFHVLIVSTPDDVSSCGVCINELYYNVRGQSCSYNK